MTLSLTNKGFNYVDYYNSGYANADSLPSLEQTHANSIATTIEYGIDPQTDTVYADPNITDSSSAFGATIREAVAQGLSVMVRPLIDFVNPSYLTGTPYSVGEWRSYFNPGAAGSAGANAFFASYQTMILHYAQVAVANGATSLCIGTELDQITGPAYKSYWDSIITAVRTNYPSLKLTYVADWNDDVSPWVFGGTGLAPGTGNLATQVSFASELDSIGIDCYAPISHADNPTLAQLIAGWTQTPIDLTSLSVTRGNSLINYFESVAAAVGKPLVFTELGYENATDAASSPAGSSTHIVDSTLQAELYQAFFEAWQQAGNSSLTGVYFWNWDPNAAEVGPGKGVNFSPQGLPAQDVVTKWFSGLLAQIQQFYSEIEYRPPPGIDPATVNAYLALSPTQVVAAIEAEAYTQNTVNPVIREYQAAFGRVPDQGGAGYWTQQFGTGHASLDQISLIFASSREFSNLYGGAGPNTPANTTLVTAFYQNVLQRAPDAGGLAYWVGTGLPAKTLLELFAQSTEFINDTNQPIINFQNLEAAGTPVTTGSLFAVPGSTSAAVSAPAAGADAGPAFAADPPAPTNDIFFQTVQTGALTINDQTAALTINTEGNQNGAPITVGAINPAPGASDSLTLIVGNAATATGQASATADSLTAFGDELVTITAQGGTDFLGYVALTPSPTGNEQVIITGDHNLTIGSGGFGAIADFNSGGGLNVNNFTLTDTDSAVVTLKAATTGTGLFFAVPGDTAGGSFGNPLTNSTNAVVIDASKSGGLIMEGGDANYTMAATVAGSVGDVITGSATAGNVLGGSIGNDTITALSNAPNTIYTGGGADTTILAAGHTASDHIDLYAASPSVSGLAPGNPEAVQFQSITDSFDVAQLGQWGLATGGLATGYNAAGTTYAGLAAETGTSADMSTVANFNVASDVLDFAGLGGWGNGGTNAMGGIAHGLTAGNLATAPANSAAGAVSVLQQVKPGDTVGASTDVIELAAGAFANATAVAAALHTSYGITFGGTLANNDSAHVLVAYQDLGGNTRIADVALDNVSGTATASSTVLIEHASDIVQLTGVSLISLTAADIHFIHN